MELCGVSSFEYAFFLFLKQVSKIGVWHHERCVFIVSGAVTVWVLKIRFVYVSSPHFGRAIVLTYCLRIYVSYGFFVRYWEFGTNTH